jgi:hypothetical protein
MIRNISANDCDDDAVRDIGSLSIKKAPPVFPGGAFFLTPARLTAGVISLSGDYGEPHHRI